MTVEYEWDVEEVADVESEECEVGDILGHNFQNSYEDCLRFVAEGTPSGVRYDIVLVRNVIDKYGSLTDRAWAYIRAGVLPKEFEGGIATTDVPKRFHKEVAKALDN